MHVGYTLAQGTIFMIPKNWILLDTCSTCDVSNNPELVHNIQECSPSNTLTAYTNGGAQKYDHIATLRMLPITVHFKADSMATILSLKTVSEIDGSRLTMYTAKDKDITLTLKSGNSFIFKQ